MVSVDFKVNLVNQLLLHQAENRLFMQHFYKLNIANKKKALATFATAASQYTREPATTDQRSCQAYCFPLGHLRLASPKLDPEPFGFAFGSTDRPAGICDARRLRLDSGHEGRFPSPCVRARGGGLGAKGEAGYPFG